MSDPIQVDDDDDWDQQDNHEAGGGTTITTTTINDEEYLNVDIENSNIEDTILLRQQQQYGNEQMIEDENGINYADGRKYQIQQDFFGGVVGQEGQQLQEEEEEEAVDILDFDESTGGVRGNIMISDSEEGVLLMRFCPHDSSMLYPQVSYLYFTFVF